MINTFDLLSDVTVYLKYAHYKEEESRRETWKEIVTRNLEMHLKHLGSFKNGKQVSRELLDKVYPLMHTKALLPSMRSLQFAGKAIERNNTRLYNCCFLPIDDMTAFSEVMYLLLGGSGVGYSIQQHHIAKLPVKAESISYLRGYSIDDSIEGWADAVKVLMEDFVKGTSTTFDYSLIRPKGAPLKTAGGKAPGPEPLRIALERVQGILDIIPAGKQLTSLQIHDIICHIADSVRAGGIRRSALIALFSKTDYEMLTCKSGAWWESNAQRGRANNSVVLERSTTTKKEFDILWATIRESRAGEPGEYWTDDIEMGTNPCVEIGLRAFQFCNL